MNAAQTLHPTDQTLRAYGLGKLDDASAESVNKHLESCSDCQRRVAELSSDSFLAPPRCPGPACFARPCHVLNGWAVDAGRRAWLVGTAAGQHVAPGAR